MSAPFADSTAPMGVAAPAPRGGAAILTRRRLFLLAAIGACAATAQAAWRPDMALRVAAGVTAHDLCTETFLSGADPARVYHDSLAPRPGYWLIGWGLRYHVDRARREVDTSIAGLVHARAVYREGNGCLLLPDGVAEPAPPVAPTAAPAEPAPAALLPPLGPDAPVAATNPALRDAIDTAFDEEPGAPIEATEAVVVLRDGHVIGERYAPGIGVDTPLLGFSMSKSIVNALLGRLAFEGHLDIHAPAPIAAWKTPGDPRAAITTEQLMRMESGLDLDESGSGFDPSNRMFYVEPDMAAYAESARLKAAPGTRWFYSSAGYHLLATIVRDAAGGGPGAMQRYAERALFQPLGMRGMTIESDATGTPIGAHYMIGPARDWARLGLLFMDNGIVGGQRLLPDDWLKMSLTPTLETDYGAGWWPNHTLNPNDERRSKDDMPLMRSLPPDAFYALGNLGQYLVVVPSRRLVVVRMGHSHAKDYDARHIERLVAAVVAAEAPEASR